MAETVEDDMVGITRIPSDSRLQRRRNRAAARYRKAAAATAEMFARAYREARP